MINLKKIEKLSSKRITLRAFTLDDKDSLFNNWGTDKEITKYMLWKNYESIDDAISSINYYLECYENNSNFRQYAITLNDTGELVGQISFTLSKKHESAEIAYLISRDYQGNGYMKESIELLIDYLFNEVGVTRISAEVMIENIPSIKLLKKLYFEEEGKEQLKYKKKDGLFSDVILFALINENRRLQSQSF